MEGGDADVHRMAREDLNDERLQPWEILGDERVVEAEQRASAKVRRSGDGSKMGVFKGQKEGLTGS